MMTKKLTAAMLCLALLLVTNIPAFAVTNSTESMIQPQYTYIKDISSTINASNGQASVYVRLRGISSVTKIVITTELQQYRNGGWSEIESWTQTTNGNSAILSESGSISSGYSYRTVSNFTVYAGSNYETASKTSNEVKY